MNQKINPEILEIIQDANNLLEGRREDLIIGLAIIRGCYKLCCSDYDSRFVSKSMRAFYQQLIVLRDDDYLSKGRENI
jgi:hypothetical protein